MALLTGAHVDPHRLGARRYLDTTAGPARNRSYRAGPVASTAPTSYPWADGPVCAPG
jgi:hypothetical protein